MPFIPGYLVIGCSVHGVRESDIQEVDVIVTIHTEIYH